MPTKSQAVRNFAQSLLIGFTLIGSFEVTANEAVVIQLPPAATAEMFANTRPEAVALGRLLFYDPILSGGRAVSCAHCHHPKFGTSDGLSLGIGDGGIGLGPNRIVDPNNQPERRIPRNSPALFNLGALDFTRFFHDGRLELDPNQPDGIRTPLGQDMISGFASLLSAQAMFPVLSADEMAGHYQENEISTVVRQGRLTHAGGAWDLIAQRVSAVSEYKQDFEALAGNGEAFDFTDIADVIAEFINFEWQAIDSPFDRYLRHQQSLPAAAERGIKLFYGKARCASCHAGLLQTDHDFHAIAMPQLGPGKAAQFETHHRDTGRFRVTGKLEDRYRFRTPSLRNVAHTSPYGHSGAYATLEAVIKHHLDPLRSLEAYSKTQLQLPPMRPDLRSDLQDANDWIIMTDASERAAIAAANELEAISLQPAEIADLVAFLHSLTDQQSLEGRLGVPASVPSGLEVTQ